jgi:hypothetical protein
MRTFFRILLGLLREIGDESAYARYLQRNKTEHSGVEWRKFSEQRMQAKYTRAKCC